MITAAEIVAAASEQAEQLDPDRFAAEATRSSAVVVDVREAEERLGSCCTATVVPARPWRP